MKTLDRYVAKNFIIGYIISLMVLVGLRVVIDLFVNLDEFAENTNPVANVLSYYAVQSTLYFRDFAGMITVVAAVFSLGKMTRNNELIAVMASGVSLKRVIAPIVFLAILFSGLLVVDQELVIPRLANRLVRSHDDISGGESYDIWFMSDSRGNLLCTKEFHEDSKLMFYPTIIIREQDREKPGIWKVLGVVKADKGFFDEKKDRWELMNVVFLRIDRDRSLSNIMPELSEYAGFEKNREVLVKEVKIGSAAEKAGLQAGDVILEVNGRDVADGQEFRVLAAQAEVGGEIDLLVYREGKELVKTGDMSSLDIVEYFYETDITPSQIPIRRQEGYKSLLSSKQLAVLARQGTRIKDLAELYSQKHFRITEPIINMVMLMVALPILVCRDPKAMKSAIMISFGITSLCFIVTFVCKMAATEAVFGLSIKPELWPWAPVFIFLPIAFIELDSMKT